MTEDIQADTGTRPQDPPLLVAATVGEVTAMWQVEVDARVLLGDFSGAWLVDTHGIQGFAQDADWIDQRHSREEVLALLLSRPVLVAGDGGVALQGSAAHAALSLPDAATVQILDVPATVAQAAAMVEENKSAFAQANPGKRQPAWSAAWGDGGFTPLPGRSPEGLEGDAREAVVQAMSAARGLRGLVQAWNALDKLRVQRIGGDLRALPLVMN